MLEKEKKVYLSILIPYAIPVLRYDQKQAAGGAL